MPTHLDLRSQSLPACAQVPWPITHCQIANINVNRTYKTLHKFVILQCCCQYWFVES